MRILFINRWVGVQKGGTESHIKELATRFAERGHSVGILTSSGREIEDLSPRIRKWYVRRNSSERPFSGSPGLGTYIFASIFSAAALICLVRLLARGYRFDIVSVHFALEAFLMRLVRLVFKIPFVFVFEGYSDIEASQARFANRQIAISRHVSEECWSQFSYRPTVIPIGVDFERFSPDAHKTSRTLARKFLNLPLEGKIALSVGRLAPHKGFRSLVQAAGMISVQHPEALVIVVGDGSDREYLEALVKSLGLTNFQLVGRVREADLPYYYWAADFFVLAETNEGFSGGLVLLEAMSAGLPIITTKIGGIPETVEDAGILIPPFDDTALANAIHRLISDEMLCQQLSVKGRFIARNRDWNLITQSYESTYLAACRARHENTPWLEVGEANSSQVD